LTLDKVTPGILINDLSDHLPIFVVIKPAHVEKLNTKPQFKHDFSNFNAEEFMEETKEALNSMISNSDNPAAALDDPIGAIKKVLDDYAPLKKMSRTQRRLAQKPWITSDLYKLTKTKNKLYRAPVRCKFDDKQEYKRYKKMRNKVNHQLEISKRKYYQSQFLEYGNDSAKMWKLINTLTNSQVKTHSYPNKLLNPINSQHTGNLEKMANIFNDYFVTVGKHIANSITPPCSNKFL